MGDDKRKERLDIGGIRCRTPMIDVEVKVLEMGERTEEREAEDRVGEGRPVWCRLVRDPGVFAGESLRDHERDEIEGKRCVQRGERGGGRCPGVSHDLVQIQDGQRGEGSEEGGQEMGLMGVEHHTSGDLDVGEDVWSQDIVQERQPRTLVAADPERAHKRRQIWTISKGEQEVI